MNGPCGSEAVEMKAVTFDDDGFVIGTNFL